MAAPTHRILVVCTANQCRSPMGEVIARDLASRRSLPVAVTSAGTDAMEGSEATDGAQMVVRRMGLDLSEHRSRLVTAELVARADLVIAMERQHVIDLVTLHGAELGAVFTLPELAALAPRAPRRTDEPIDAWLHRITADRDANTALAAPEVDDPIGRSMRRYRATARLVARSFETVLDAYEGRLSSQ